MALFRQALGKNEQFVLDRLTVTNEQEFFDAVDRKLVLRTERKGRGTSTSIVVANPALATVVPLSVLGVANWDTRPRNGVHRILEN